MEALVSMHFLFLENKGVASNSPFVTQLAGKKLYSKAQGQAFPGCKFL